MILGKVALFAVLTITLAMIPPAVASVPAANEDAAGDISGDVIPALPPGPVGAANAQNLFDDFFLFWEGDDEMIGSTEVQQIWDDYKVNMISDVRDNSIEIAFDESHESDLDAIRQKLALIYPDSANIMVRTGDIVFDVDSSAAGYAETRRDAPLPGAEAASPLKQHKSGVPSDEIRCRADLVPVQKIRDGAAACVGESAAENLIERGWASKILAEKPAKHGTASANEAISDFVIGDLIKNQYGGDLANIPPNDIPTLRAANEIALAMAHEDSLISESTAQLYGDYYINGLGVVSDGTGPAVYVGIHPSESDREAEIRQKLSEIYPDVSFCPRADLAGTGCRLGSGDPVMSPDAATTFDRQGTLNCNLTDDIDASEEICSVNVTAV